MIPLRARVLALGGVARAVRRSAAACRWRVRARSTPWRSSSSSRNHCVSVTVSGLLPGWACCSGCGWVWPRRFSSAAALSPFSLTARVAVGPCLVLRVAGFELLPSGGELAGECAGAGGFGGVVADLGVGGLLAGVGFGVGGGP